MCILGRDLTTVLYKNTTHLKHLSRHGRVREHEQRRATRHRVCKHSLAQDPTNKMVAIAQQALVYLDIFQFAWGVSFRILFQFVQAFQCRLLQASTFRRKTPTPSRRTLPQRSLFLFENRGHFPTQHARDKSALVQDHPPVLVCPVFSTAVDKMLNDIPGVMCVYVPAQLPQQDCEFARTDMPTPILVGDVEELVERSFLLNILFRGGHLCHAREHDFAREKEIERRPGQNTYR